MSANYLLSDDFLLLLAAIAIIWSCIEPETSVSRRWFRGLCWGTVAIMQIIRIAT